MDISFTQTTQRRCDIVKLKRKKKPDTKLWNPLWSSTNTKPWISLKIPQKFPNKELWNSLLIGGWIEWMRS
jgi:hypothetical protein